MESLHFNVTSHLTPVKVYFKEINNLLFQPMLTFICFNYHEYETYGYENKKFVINRNFMRLGAILYR